MKKLTIPAIAALGLSVALAAPSFAVSFSKTSAEQQAKANKNFRQSLLSMINQERRTKNLPPMRISKKLNQVAQQHSQHMAEKRILTHTGKNNSEHNNRINNAGIQADATAENIASGFATTPKEIYSLWASSKEHMQNINGPFTMIGFGKTKAKNGTIYWAADFANK